VLPTSQDCKISAEAISTMGRACDFAASFDKARRLREYNLDKREGLTFPAIG
jgi:hypothetical protein